MQNVSEYIAACRSDERWRAMVRGLCQLDETQLARLTKAALDDPHDSTLLTDGGNYDPQSQRWCALAVGLGVPASLDQNQLQVSDARSGRAALREFGELAYDRFSTNPLSGIRGEIFTTNRLFDLRVATVGLIKASGIGIDTSREAVTSEFAEQVAALGVSAVLEMTHGHARG